MEYKKCLKNTPYALKTYLSTFDNTQKKHVPLDLFPDQINLINDYDDYEENIALKYRQAGVSTVTSAWCSKKIVTAKKSSPEKILIIANKKDTATEMANKVRSFLNQWPSWFGVDFVKEKNAASHYRLSNGCEVKAVATSKDALRGYTPTILVFDEAAYIEADSDFWAACMASLSTGGKVIVISTPNGYDPIYYGIYSQAQKGLNDFRITEMFWYRDPRYAKDLRLVKVDNIIHYMRNREKYEDSEISIDYGHINPRERNIKEIGENIKKGYRPYSSWFEKMAKKLKFDERKINQELNCAFLGSGDNVIPAEKIESIKENDVIEPTNKFMGGALWQWKEPVEGHKYILGIDVSSGESDDFTGMVMIDFDEREQVLEYYGKVPPDVAADIGYKWATLYNAMIVVDVTGGMGIATTTKLEELRYKNLYYEGQSNSDKWSAYSRVKNKKAGLNFNHKRVQIIAAFEEAVRNDFKIRSSRLASELDTFVYINGRPDHMKGQHDDLIMSLSMPIYISEYSFADLEKANKEAKTLLDNWVLHESDKEIKKTYFDPLMPSFPSDKQDIHGRQQINKEDYQKYSWLFGGKM